MAEKTSPLEAINNSGFPLQIAIAHAIDSANADWKVTFKEHYWKHPHTSESGYIDLIIEYFGHVVVFIVECKRALDTNWIFLTSKKDQARTTARMFFSSAKAPNGCHEWRDTSCNPPSPKSDMCVIPGKDNNGRPPLLERIASDVVSSTEAFANEEWRPLIAHKGLKPLRVYVNLIVTTATLKVCEINPSDISLKDGKLPDNVY